MINASGHFWSVLIFKALGTSTCFLTGAAVLVLISGCRRPPDDLRSTNGSFTQIEGAVQDMHANVFGKYYSGDLGDDRLGFAMIEFQKSVKGTPLESDAEKLARKINEVSTLASKRPPIAKLRKAVQELQDVVAEVKKKL